MENLILFGLSILPAVLLLRHFAKKDKGDKEPAPLLWKVFFWGVAVTFIAAFVEVMAEDFLDTLISAETNFWLYIGLDAFLAVALVEEGLKMWVVKSKAFNKPSFNEVMDGITYTIVVSMGFATLENIFYVLGSEGGMTVAIIRALISVPSHALFSGIMGYYIGVAKFAKREDRSSMKMLFEGLSWGIIYHGTFDFLLFSGQPSLALSVFPLIYIMSRHLKFLIKKAQVSDGVA